MMRSGVLVLAAIILAVMTSRPAAARELEGAVSTRKLPLTCTDVQTVEIQMPATGAHPAGVSRHVRCLHKHTRQGLLRLALDPAASLCTISNASANLFARVNYHSSEGPPGLLLSVPAVASSILRQLGGRHLRPVHA